ncbi:hypothetical protein [Streptomyces sp. NBC_00687]|uniref:hypothetical protein n=1 Tax=Streptomyces sp. NBC_00687 TaxID=2975807 RepID=UPI002253AB5F|nr:hypothetical protein [Streptomyces sp. NBC_00687]MCX4919950.1 hypothetical protein [Streptomyces sp. NBC_00687]
MKPNLSRPALKLSQLPPENLQLREGERRSLVCPDCKSWRFIRRGVVWPHRGKDGSKCDGSARRVQIDVDLEEWGRTLTELDATVTGRRATRVNPKPKTATPPPVSRLATIPKEATRLPAVVERARIAVIHHRLACTRCESGGRCERGRELEIFLAETRASLDFLLEQREAKERQEARIDGRERAAQWRRVQPSVARTDKLRHPETLQA